MYYPVTSYRIQFHKDFNFDKFSAICDYLCKLGVATIYASPLFSAVPGSTHGYDVTDANRINHEIGKQEQLIKLSEDLHANGVGWMQDIVPNHMAYHINNQWLMDVLARGPESSYSSYFDIDRQHPDFNGKLMLPVLDKPLDEAIDSGAFQIALSNGRPVIKFNNVAYPINEASIPEDKTIVDWLQQINTSTKLLSELLAKQYYQFSYWKETNEHINYRRFFIINGMICLNVQNEETFIAYHRLVQELKKEGVIDAVRIDHIDGLDDPTEYLYRLRNLLGDDTYIVAEKILEPDERLPEYWPIQGTTGYDFIPLVNNLMTNNSGIIILRRFYNELVGQTSADREILEKKNLILHNYMAGELDNLLRLLPRTISSGKSLSDERLKAAIALFLVHFPVYRFYSNTYLLDETEKKQLQNIFNEIKAYASECIDEVQYLEALLINDNPETEDANAIAKFFKRCMQFTGPIMAKGVEDTVMYTYNSYIGHNEVGDSPSAALYTVEEFHKAMQERQKKWPLTMNTTATHDTKHGEDARARLNAITHFANDWMQMVNEWRTWNLDYKQGGAPTDNDEYFIYQALVASYPMPGADVDDFEDRFKSYIQKAIREAKVHTNWDDPNEDYEKAVSIFIEKILNPASRFMHSFLQYHEQISDAGILLSLSQLILKCTCPGIPDIYQGCELWDLSMVDPDNRRPVDYELRKKWLKEIEEQDDLTRLWEERYNGKIKLWFARELLSLRKGHKELFEKGSYLPLVTGGRYADNIVAYARVFKNEWCLVITCITSLPVNDWDDTYVSVGNDVSFENIFNNEKIKTTEKVYLKEIMNNLPFAVLKGNVKNNKRKAGVLLPVFSLSGEFCIGDFGKGARSFVDKLQQGKQRIWQILPLNPVNASNMYSPYSSLSAMASNALLVSPELLVKDGLIDNRNVDAFGISNTGKVDYKYAEDTKVRLLDAAYDNFLRKNFAELRYAYQVFCEKEKYWLDDFALFMALKQENHDKPWYDWPLPYKTRDEKTLQAFTEKHRDELQKTKWVQFIIDRQWKDLKRYSNDKGVKILGDLPFYVSYDSVDVWSNAEIFTLDADGAMIGVAGVPPDYFTKDGQLWGVPTFNWEKLKASNYEWWIKRMKRNIELFDMVRIDHFRALEAYWEVPAGEETARYGQWKKGPGVDFFNYLKEALQELPLVAEDLGYEMDDVYALREKTGLPGMKVLQFAWGDNMSISVDAPHNYSPNCIAYTGTHDNNTTLGWFRNETTEEDKKRLASYAGTEVNEHNVTDVLTKMVYGSVANTAIIPMQDILKLDEHARMNTPGTIYNNWLWRMDEHAFDCAQIEQLKYLVEFYNRG
ncbi:MAG: hypothetical protein BGO70_18485 [Bacteroidetes bacterium 43-93]|nr:malto-oligosyltrehalose synthase [Bacteroidota bacterium]OJX01717.1 MAG: hypothetical protein BGO70_18485 [Bacteroidetes bacterium 43-93]